MATIAEELNALMAQLPPQEQEHVLNFARDLAWRAHWRSRIRRCRLERRGM